jgi:integrase
MSPSNILIFKQVKMKSIYTNPKIVKYDDLKKSWFVFFRYNKKLFRFKFGINYQTTYKKRLIEAEALCDALAQKLKEGWNPNIPDVAQENVNYTFIEAIDFAIEKKKSNIGPKTLSGYNGTIKFIKDAIEKIKLQHLEISKTKRSHIKLIMEKAKEQRNWSNKAYNKHLNHLKAILSELIQWDIIEVNPAHNIKNLKVSESMANVPGTENELKLISKELSENHYNFWVFVLTIFYTGIRPEEILKLKLSNLSLEKNQIVIPAQLTKTNIERIVPINPHFKIYLEKMNLSEYQKDFYLFGSYRISGRGNVGKLDDFIPGPTKLKRDTATKRWKSIVKDKLGIENNMYAMKKHGANKMILADVSIDAIKDLFGHTSQMTTKIYITNLKEVNRKQILEKAPSF